jgi:hypothetical protein
MKNKTVKEKAKRLLVLFGLVLIFAGCGAAARESEFYQHNTMYRDWDHLKFSIYGYKKADPLKVQESKAHEWWGIAIEEPRE